MGETPRGGRPDSDEEEEFDQAQRELTYAFEVQGKDREKAISDAQERLEDARVALVESQSKEAAPVAAAAQEAKAAPPKKPS